MNCILILKRKYNFIKGGMNMGNRYSWIYVDYIGNIWKFSKNDSRELLYNIMYEEGKWTKERLIDEEVLAFAVYIDKDETIHIVYSNNKGDLKYCTMRNKQWVGRTLYDMDSNEFEIQNLNVEIIDGEMHIFYMLIANDGSDHGVLVHFRWNGKEAKVNALQDIILAPNVKTHYLLQINNKKDFNIYFLTDEGDEVALQYCSFQNNRWTAVKRLYGIQGDNICIELLTDEVDIHILNGYREDSTYLLEHTFVDINGNIRGFRVYEGSVNLLEPLLFSEGTNLYCCWLENNKIFYSTFDGEGWITPICVDKSNTGLLQRYYSFIAFDEKRYIKKSSIYGTLEPDLNLFIPSHFIKEINGDLNIQVNKIDSKPLNDIGEIRTLKVELQRIKVENTNLDKKISALNMQLQKKQRFVEEYEDTISKILEQKRKLEENCKIYLEVQQNSQKELERIKKQLLDESLITSETNKKLNECEEKNKELQTQIQRTADENQILSIQIKKVVEDNAELQIEYEKIRKVNEEFVNEINKLETERKLLRKEVEEKKVENLRLFEELQLEKNQSIMDRLLRRRSNEL